MLIVRWRFAWALSPAPAEHLGQGVERVGLVGHGLKAGCCRLVGGACQPSERVRCSWFGPEGWLAGCSERENRRRAQ